MTRIGHGHGPIARPPSNDTDAKESESTGKGEGPQSAGGGENRKRVLAAAEAERLAAESGFVRGGKKRRAIDLGDSSEAAIPLPQDDLEGLELTTEGLEVAERALLRHYAALRRRGKRSDLLGLWQALLQGDEDESDEQQHARQHDLEAIEGQVPPSAEQLAQLRHTIALEFGAQWPDCEPGAMLMATSLLVAGQGDEVQARKGPNELDAEKLFHAASRVIDAGRQAAEDARSRAETTAKHLNLQRTFVPKR